MKKQLISIICAMFMWPIPFALTYGVYYTPPKENQSELVVPAKVASVYDGDTITLQFNLKVNTRLLDCYAPEVRSKDKAEKENGIKSKDFLKTMLKENDEVMVRIPLTDNISESISLSRVLAYVYKDTDGDGELNNISEEMVEAGHATKTK